ncbi:MAG: tRNA uridine-5-carboxymethylaminomethyl(34) synthesis GTPase MnmE [Thermodesulfobacteriota bacterium]
MNQPEHTPSDTIAALSTPRGYSGVGVIRMSGPHARTILACVFRPALTHDSFPDRRAVYGRVVDPEQDKVLDDGVAVFMSGPSTYTGEDVVELSLHGSPVVLDIVLETLLKQGARLAQRGEFTRRAFLAGKLDLVQAEAVIDLIEASSAAGATEARARLDRTLSREIRTISDSIKDLLSEVEASIDFDEEDEDTLPDPEPALRHIAEMIQILRKSAQVARLQRQGINTVIVGKPNVGKSTLFNALLKTDRTIVTPHPGTTRDLVDESLRVGGACFVLCDTAGIRRNPDPVEAEGIQRTRARIRDADLALAMLDGSVALDPEDDEVLAACEGKETLIVVNKTDLGLKIDPEEVRTSALVAGRFSVSAKTGQGIDKLTEMLRQMGEDKTRVPVGSHNAGLSQRGLLLVNAAWEPINEILRSLEAGEKPGLEIVSLELRRSLESLQEITGERVDEGVLDRIFERFCVGK